MNKVTLVTSIICALLSASVVPVLAEENETVPEIQTPAATEQPAVAPVLLIAADETPPDESFYFGEGEEEVWRQKQIELIRFQDKTGKATKTMERVIGLTIFTTGAMMAVWGAFFYYDRHTPYDYYFGGKKYKEIGYVPLIKEHEIYWPSVVAGVSLSATSLYLLVRPQGQ